MAVQLVYRKWSGRSIECLLTYLFDVCVFHDTEDNSKYGRKHSETMALRKEGEEYRLMK